MRCKIKECGYFRLEVLIWSVSSLKLILLKHFVDLAEKESKPQAELANLDMDELKSLTINEMQNRLVAANNWSFENFGKKGSDLMNLRKRHLKKIRKAKKAIIDLSQLTLPDMGDFPDGGEPA